MTRFVQIVCLTVLSSIVVGYGCKKEPKSDNNDIPVMLIPKGFPAMTFPEGNEYSEARWALGKRLFYERKLSLNNTINCASCHQANNAFGDKVAFSFGDNNAAGTSNAPTLTNIGYNPYFTRAGGVPTLEMQILVPIQEHNEFNSNIVDIVAELGQDSSYAKQAKNAYNRAFDAFVLTRAIANFERSLISGNAPFDKFENGKNPSAISAAAQRGYALFTSTKTNCTQCHSGFNFSNYAFENNGLYTNYADSGRMRLTKLESDRAKFKVPTLRNVGLSAPYMHDGSMNTLKEVVTHYNIGGVPHKNKSDFIKPLRLTEQEQADLVAFLNSLSDNSFVENKNFQE